MRRVTADMFSPSYSYCPIRKPGQSGKSKTLNITGKAAIGKGAKANESNKKTAEIKKPKEPTKEDLAAVVIQKWIRRFLGQRKLKRMRKEKADYEEMMEKLEREAFLAVVKREQEALEKERLKEQEERRKKKENLKRQKRILEAAFDGEDDEIRAVLKEVDAQDTKDGIPHTENGMVLRAKHQLAIINCEDPNGNTPLSEAASGGSATTLQLLLERGADVNSQGQFKRTPLYRAAFAGHLEAVQLLLQSGADPRLYASDGATPEQVASVDTVKQVLVSWDIEATESILENQLKEAEKDYNGRQKQLQKAYGELNKRIEEHDKCMLTGYKTEITLQAVHEAERELELIKLEAEKSREKLAEIKLMKREQEKAGAEEEDLVGVKCNFKELDDVLMRDVGDKIKNDGRWPLLIDSSGRAAMFLQYRDTNLINALHPSSMEPEKIRLAVLGSIRYGKPLVLDMMNVDMYDASIRRFDEIHEGLLNLILTKEILKEEKYSCLMKESDGPEYKKNQFNEHIISGFKLIIVSKIEPNEELLEKMYPIRIVVG
ncbi:putative IQ motif and ankyrin repeat domain-containing protein [Apostichopus japonicus]|uniref:Putative IQ motif and ankyrin repeat domain-containing protein n=1 Tax=Stichopus japonicus TaxID=307972 RepID=A0A2G8JYM8_STIJA|nr:putative IQ motif and ankyrin repeat domain-containing protein [Apostichopus japonicus]